MFGSFFALPSCMAFRGGPEPSPAGRQAPNVSVTVVFAPNIPPPPAAIGLLAAAAEAPPPLEALVSAWAAVRLEDPPEPCPLLVGLDCMAPIEFADDAAGCGLLCAKSALDILYMGSPALAFGLARRFAASSF